LRLSLAPSTQEQKIVNVFGDTQTTVVIDSLSLHDALPLLNVGLDKPKNFKKTFRRLLGFLRPRRVGLMIVFLVAVLGTKTTIIRDRKSTRLNSSHVSISYAVFCLKKKK